MAGGKVLRMLVQLVPLLPPATSYPTYIGCDLQVMPTKLGAGRNVMTTTGAIMGAPPTNDGNLVSASVTGSIVTLTFSGAFSMGIAHATIGTFTAPQFSGTPDVNAAKCAGTQSIKYKDASGVTNSIVWQAPAQIGTAASVTLSFAGASGYGTISRHTITLTLSNAPGSTATSTATLTTPPPASTSPGSTATSTATLTTPPPASTSPVTTLPPTVTQPVTSVTPTTTQNSGNLSGSDPGRFKLIKTGNCVSNRMSTITDRPTCEAAAQALQTAYNTATVISDTPRPPGCFLLTKTNLQGLYLSTNPANAPYGASSAYELLCLNTASNVASASPSDNKVMIGSIAGGALLLCLAISCCFCRYRCRTKSFEA